MRAHAVIQLTNSRVYGLLGVQLDDEVLFDGQIDILSGGSGNNLANHIGGIEVEPLGDHVIGVGLEIELEALDAAAGLLQGDHHAGLDLVAGNVDLLAVDGEVTG